MQLCRFFGGAIATLGTSIAFGQPCGSGGPINVELDGVSQGMYFSGDNIIINIPTDLAGVRTLRIWSPVRNNGLPCASIGTLTINGTDTNSDGQLRVMLANSGVAFPIDPTLPYVETDLGLVHLHSIVIPNETLRRRTRLVAGLSGDITGPVTVGQVHRLQVGGTISGPVTAFSRNREFFNTTNLEFNSIEYLSAAMVTADIVALGDSLYVPGDPTTYARIGRLALGGGGLRANILANKGTIQEIFCLGDISPLDINNINDPTFFPRIEAADGIGFVRARHEQPFSHLARAAWRVRLKGNTVVNEPTYVSTVLPRVDRSPTSDGTIHLMETDGAIYGNIVCNNLAWKGVPGSTPEDTHYGIFAGEGIRASVTVNYLVDRCDIIAGQVAIVSGLEQHELVIGRQLRGSIVSFPVEHVGGGSPEGIDPCPNTYVHNVSVGRSAGPFPAYVAARTPGFVGSDEYFDNPNHSNAKSVWYLRGCPQSPTHLTVNPYDDTDGHVGCYDGGSADSVIRLYNAGEINLSAMSVVATIGATTTTRYPPRIECSRICRLIIDEMRCGTVVGADFGYAGIDYVMIGCIGAAAEVNVQACREFDVLGDVFGRVQYPALELSCTPDRVIPTRLRIGGGLIPFTGLQTDCTALYVGDAWMPETSNGPGQYFPLSNTEEDVRNSQRMPRQDPDFPTSTWGGEIEMRSLRSGCPGINLTDDGPITGQVILHAFHVGPDQDLSMWQGHVRASMLPMTPEKRFVTWSGLTPEYVSPQYAMRPGVPYAHSPTGGFGVGAVGLVPFAVHVPQSNFLNAGMDNASESDLLASAWNSQTPLCDGPPPLPTHARIEFYGPIKILPPGSSTRAPVSVEFCAWADTDGDGTADTQLWSEVSNRLVFSVDPDNSRILRIKPVSGWVFPAGTYRVQTWTMSSHQRLVCDELLTTADVPVRAMRADATPSTAYYFTVLADCDPMDCVPDCPTDTTQLCCGLPLLEFLCDSIDFNNDGLFPDTQDLEDFLSVLEGGPCSTGDCNDLDFNNDGLFPDTLDYDAFLSRFAGGPCLW